MAPLRIAVVGLGIYGASILSNLARQRDAAGLDIELVGFDALTPPHAQGSSHGNSRICRMSNFESYHLIDSARRSIQLLQDLYADPGVQAYLTVAFPPALGVTLDSAPPLFTRNGVLFFGPSTDMQHESHGEVNAVQQTIRFAIEYNEKAVREGKEPLRFELLNGNEITRRFPYFTLRSAAEADGDAEESDDVRGFLDVDAGTLFPERCVGAFLFDARRRENVTIVQGIRIDGHTTLPDGRVQLRASTACQHVDQPFDVVIFSAGIWIGDLIPSDLQSHFMLERHLFAWLETKPGQPTHDFSVEKGAPCFIRYAFRKEPMVMPPDAVVPPAFEATFKQIQPPPVPTVNGMRHVDFFYGFPNNLTFGEPVKIAQENAAPFNSPLSHTFVTRTQSVNNTGPSDDFVPTSYREVHDAESRRMLYAASPYLGGLTGKVLSKAACAYTVQPAHKFIVDWIPSANGADEESSSKVLVVSCCSGHGFKHAPAIAEAVAGLVLSRLCGAPRLYPQGIFAFDVDTPRPRGADEYSWKTHDDPRLFHRRS